MWVVVRFGVVNTYDEVEVAAMDTEDAMLDAVLSCDGYAYGVYWVDGVAFHGWWQYWLRFVFGKYADNKWLWSE